MTHLSRLCALLSVAFLIGIAFSPVQAQDAFITTWETSSPNESITIPTDTSESDYGFEINWGDGTTETVTGTDPDPSHSYNSAGTYQVEINGTFPRIFLNAGTFGDGREANADKLQSIDQWGSIQWESMEAAFAGAGSMTYDATDTPDLSSVTSMRQMFSGAYSFGSSFTDGNFGEWDTSGVTDMGSLFLNANSFNQDISGWDVSSVTNMSRMFWDARSFNQDIGTWDVSNVTDMSAMFLGADRFNQYIGDWDTGNVTDMTYMFRDTEDFNGDIGNWDVSSVTDMGFMFWRADSFNQDISEWDVSNVTKTDRMFRDSRFNQDLNSWDVSNVTTMRRMFKDASFFDGNISSWNVSKVTDMSEMFDGAVSFNQDIGGWDVSSVATMEEMFLDAVNFNQDIGEWDVSNVSDMSSMFQSAISFDQDLGTWDVSEVRDSYSQNSFEDFLAGVDLSTSNYDALLVGWSQLDLNDGLTFDGGQNQFCNSGPFRTHLEESFGWTVNDAGQQNSCPNTLEVSGTHQIGGDDTFSFGSVPVEIDYSGTGSALVTVSRYGNAPENVEDIPESNVSSYRLIVAGGDLPFYVSDSADLRFPVSDYGGIDQPEEVTIYARPQPGEGSFEALQTDVDDNGTPGDISDDTLSATTDSFSEFVFASDTNPLPVELAEFEGTATERNVRLTWQTASETNNAGFKVQWQREDSWTQIGYVDSKTQGGTTSETKSYNYTADDLPVGTHQFRLKQVDLDGSSTLTDPVSVKIQMQEAVKLTAPAPNPVSSTATLSFAVKEQTETTITLYNTLGQRVATLYEGTPQTGEQQRTQLNATGLSSGTYFLRLQAGAHTTTQQVTVVR
jgi:surface protein